MKIQDIKADLHTHGFCGWSKGFGQGVLNILGDLPQRDLKTIADRGFKEEQNTLIGMVNFDDTRYEGLVNTRGDLPRGEGYEVYDDHRKVFVGVNRRGLWNFMVRGQEIPSNEGHILVVGADRQIRSRDVKDIVREAGDTGALVIGDHVLAHYGLLGKVFCRVFNKSPKLSLGREGVEKYAEHFDAIEVCNSNFPGLTEETAKIAKEMMLPAVYTSDSHTLPIMFSSYMVFPEMDFSNPETMRASLRQAISSNPEHYCGRNRRFENLWHGLAVAYGITRHKMGIVKKENVEII